MDDWKGKIYWIIGALVVLDAGMLFTSRFVIDATADKVIEKIRKEYSPSPYGPGFDPDKFDRENINKHKMYFESSKPSKNTSIQPDPKNVSWRDEWEKNRGFSQE